MMQLKGVNGEKSKNTERYKKALGMSSAGMRKGMTAEEFRESMPSVKAAREAAERGPAGPIREHPNIRGRTMAREDDEDPVTDDENDSDLEELMCDKDDDDFMSKLRAKRITELKLAQKKQQTYKQAGQGCYEQINESEFLPTLNKSKHVIVHFAHKDFPNCLVLDKHLTDIARRHLETKIVRLDAEKAPFFTTKLGVIVLPTIITFIDGISKERLVGFDDLGGHPEFKTEVLEGWLRTNGMLKKTEEQKEDDKEAAEEFHKRMNNQIYGGVEYEAAF